MLQGQRARHHSLLLLLAFALVAGVGANLAHTLPAKAYTTTGHRWVNGNWVTVYQTSMQPQDTQGFNDGTGAWDQSIGPGAFAPPGFGSQVVEQDYNAGQNGAVAWESDAPSGFDCNNGYAILSQAFVTLNIYYSSREDRPTIQGDAAHELGHALGLGHSLDPTALMYYAQNGVNTPQTDDLNGTNYIYGQSCH